MRGSGSGKEWRWDGCVMGRSGGENVVPRRWEQVQGEEYV